MCNIKDYTSDSDDSLLPDEEEDSDESDGSSTSIEFYEEEDEESDAQNNDHNSDAESEGEKPEVVDLLWETIQRIRKAERTHPPQIECVDVVVDLTFHPKTNLLATALFNGDVTIYKYDLDSTSVVLNLEVHRKACRAVEFSEDGQLLFTISKDKSIMITDSETGKLKEFYDEAHESSLYSLAVINEHLFSTGDEEGVVRLWDRRHRTPIFSMSKAKDYISGMVTNDSKRYLACTSAEGTVTTLNIPAKKFHAESEQYEAELTCCGVFKEESKLVCCTANGKLVIYNWGDFGLHVDEFPGPTKKGINCQVAINDNLIVTGSEDGQIRATHLLPNKHLGVVGQHRLSVDSIDISHDGEYLASCSLDEKIRFWPINFFNEIDLNIDVASTSNLPSSLVANRKDFFAELGE